MSAFADLKQFKDAVLRILGEAPDIRAAKRAIRALPGPSTVHGGVGGMIADDPPIVVSGVRIEVLGEITVRFKEEDGSREANVQRCCGAL